MRRTDPENTTRSYFRARDRLFSLNGDWFFTTREGENGPFRSREAALTEIDRFVQARIDLDTFQKARELEGRRRTTPPLSIVPKEEELDLSLDRFVASGRS